MENGPSLGVCRQASRQAAARNDRKIVLEGNTACVWVGQGLLLGGLLHAGGKL